MNDGQNEAATSTGPQTPTPVPEASQPQGLWAVPAETAELLRTLNSQCETILQRVGSLEVEYLAAKQTTLEELKTKRVLFKNILDEAAKKAGVDLEKSKWNLDMRNMTLVRAS